jgi:aminopeptidase N
LSEVRTGTLKNIYGSATLPKIVWRALQIIFSPFCPQNTETPQLWAELEAASGPEYPVEAVMKTWTEQKGFPVITVLSKQVIILSISFALFTNF